MKKLICGIVLLLILSMTIQVFAHPGRLDKNGGHNVNADGWGYPVGSYHYHHGNDRDTAYDKNDNVIPKNNGGPNPTSVPTPTVAPAQESLPSPAPTSNNINADDINPITVVVDGETILFDQPPENINGRIMVPIRYVVEKMGCSVEWDGVTQTVYIKEADTVIEKAAVKTENINVYVNNEKIIFADQQPINKNGRILIPVRFVTEKLGYSVEWDNVSRTVYIGKQN